MYKFIHPLPLHMGAPGKRSEVIANRMEGCELGQLFLATYNPGLVHLYCIYPGRYFICQNTPTFASMFKTLFTWVAEIIGRFLHSTLIMIVFIILILLLINLEKISKLLALREFKLTFFYGYYLVEDKKIYVDMYFCM